MCRNIIPYYSNTNPNNSYRVGLLQEGVIDIEFTALSSTATLGLGGDLPQAINIGGSTPEVAVSLSKLLFIQYPVMQQINPLLYSYRYGFNGQEREPSINDGVYDFGARMYDGRIGRFFSTDPLKAKYPSESNYSFAANTPISVIDYLGLEKTFYLFFLESTKNQFISEADKRAIIDKVEKICALNGMPDINVVDYNTSIRQDISIFDNTDQAIYLSGYQLLSSVGLNVPNTGNSGFGNSIESAVSLEQNLEMYATYTYKDNERQKIYNDLVFKYGANKDKNGWIAFFAFHELSHNLLNKAAYGGIETGGHFPESPNILSPGSLSQVPEYQRATANCSGQDMEPFPFEMNDPFLRYRQSDMCAIQDFMYDGVLNNNNTPIGGITYSFNCAYNKLFINGFTNSDRLNGATPSKDNSSNKFKGANKIAPIPTR